MAQKIINWNCRGFNMNLNEIQLLLNDYDPMAVCLQETFLKPNKTINLRKYEQFHSFSLSSNDRVIGGSTILVKKKATYRELKLNTNLQAVAISISAHKTFTLCSIYLPPSTNVMERELEDLINQLPAPHVIVGDLNAHSHLWGCRDSNTKGKIIESILEEKYDN